MTVQKFLLSGLFLSLSSCSKLLLYDLKELSPKDSTQVVYGEDTRVDLPFSLLPPEAAATALLVFEHKLKSPASTLGNSFPLCSDEPFQDQPRLGYCSGVLVSRNRVLTAGHCIKTEDDCAQTLLLFGFTNDRTFRNIQKSEIYRCKRILTHENSKTADFVLIEIDRNVRSVDPVVLATEAELLQSFEWTSFSYPLGLPLKKDQAKLMELKPSLNFFKMEVDTFKGSSGSPLFNQDGKLVGILSSGSEDYLEDDQYRIQTQGGCLNFHRCLESGSCVGERYFKTYLLKDLIFAEFER